MSLSTEDKFSPNQWKTKLWCAYCNGYFPMKLLKDHFSCDDHPTRVGNRRIRLCELFVDGESYAQISHTLLRISGCLRLLMHGTEGRFYARHQFTWTNPSVWAPMWAAKIIESDAPKRDKEIVVPLAAQDGETRDAIEALLLMSPQEEWSSVIQRIARELVDDHNVANLFTIPDIGKK